MLWAKRLYEPLLALAFKWSKAVLVVATVAVVATGVLASKMGSEFIPNLHEGDLAIQALRVPGTSLSQSLAMQQLVETRLMTNFPEIVRLFARTGTAVVAHAPMTPNTSVGYILLQPYRKSDVEGQRVA